MAAAALLALTALPGMPQQTSADRHTESGTTGPIVESAEAMKVTTVIQCFCGGCVNQTLHECTCGFAAGQRDLVARQLTSGRAPEEIIAAYVAEHGPQIRIVPERRGLDAVGFMVPWVVSAAALVAFAIVLGRWRSRGLPAAGGPPLPASGLDVRYRERLERDLREIDS